MTSLALVGHVRHVRKPRPHLNRVHSGDVNFAISIGIPAYMWYNYVYYSGGASQY